MVRRDAGFSRCKVTIEPSTDIRLTGAARRTLWNSCRRRAGRTVAGLAQRIQYPIALCVSNEISNAQPKLRNVPIMMYSATLRWLASFISPNRRIDFAAIRKPIPPRLPHQHEQHDQNPL